MKTLLPLVLACALLAGCAGYGGYGYGYGPQRANPYGGYAAYPAPQAYAQPQAYAYPQAYQQAPAYAPPPPQPHSIFNFGTAAGAVTGAVIGGNTGNPRLRGQNAWIGGILGGVVGNELDREARQWGW